MVLAEVRSEKRSSWHSLMRVTYTSRHLAAGAIDLLVEVTGLGFFAWERGHDKARIALAPGPFRLGDDPARAAPAIERRPDEVLEAASGFAGARGFGLGRGQLRRDLGNEPGVARQPEQVIDLVGLAPHHQVFAAEPGIGPQQDAGARPLPADLGHEAGNLVHRAGGCIDVR